MHKIVVAIVVGALSFSSLPALAQDNAETLVAGMRKAEMTYKELMAIMGRSISMMQDGVITQNRELVEQGANIIFTHPAPDHPPWAIMELQDQDGFKQALLTYDKVLDENTNEILKATRNREWINATAALSQLQTSCVSCHLQWKDKAQKWPRRH
jgi:hypothetical protein